MPAPTRPTSPRTLAALLLAAAALAAALGAFRVHREHRVVELGYELAEASAELRDVREESRRLRLELAVLTAPDRIEELAVEMGLGPAAPSQIRPEVPASEGGANAAAARSEGGEE